MAPPTLLSTIPIDNSVGQSPKTTSIYLTFSEPVTVVPTKNIVIKKSDDNTTVETIAVTDVKVSGTGTNYIVIDLSLIHI